MASLYSPQYLALPLHVQGRLPPVLQSVDFEVVMVFHSALSLFAAGFWVHQPWALPLALFGLVASTPSLTTNLLPHFLAFWIASIPLDIVWLIHRSDQARAIIISLMGFNMCFKLVSAGQAARALQSQGAIPDVEGFGAGGPRAGQPWLSGGTAAPFGLPGSWSGGGGGGQDRAAYRDAAHSAQQPASAAPYQSIYDEEANGDADAPQVHVDNVARSVAAAAGKQDAKGTRYSAVN